MKYITFTTIVKSQNEFRNKQKVRYAVQTSKIINYPFVLSDKLKKRETLQCMQFGNVM